MRRGIQTDANLKENGKSRKKIQTEMEGITGEIRLLLRSDSQRINTAKKKIVVRKEEADDIVTLH